MKKTKDYDNTFKSLKVKHKRLFITCINEAFNKAYPLNAEVEVLPSEGFIVNLAETKEKDIEERDNDFFIRIENDYYLIECQSYDDDYSYTYRFTLSVMRRNYPPKIIMKKL